MSSAKLRPTLAPTPGPPSRLASLGKKVDERDLSWPGAPLGSGRGPLTQRGRSGSPCSQAPCGSASLSWNVLQSGSALTCHRIFHTFWKPCPQAHIDLHHFLGETRSHWPGWGHFSPCGPHRTLAVNLGPPDFYTKVRRGEGGEEETGEHAELSSEPS